MSDKARRTVTIDQDIDSELDRKDNLNASATVNELLRLYLAAGKEPEAALTMRRNEIETDIKTKRQEIARLESEVERLEREKEDITARIRQRDENQHQYVAKVVEKIRAGDMDRDQLHMDNPAIQTQADNANLPVSRFIERVEAEVGDG